MPVPPHDGHISAMPPLRLYYFGGFPAALLLLFAFSPCPEVLSIFRLLLFRLPLLARHPSLR